MPKGRKRYTRKNNQQEPENTGFFGDREKREKTPEEKREYLKLFLFMITWIIFLAGVYMVCIRLEFGPVLHIYPAIGLILFIVWLIYNGGFRRIETENLEKPEDTSYEEFCAYVEKLKERQRKAKYFLVLFIPFPMIILADYVILIWGERLLG